MTGHCQNHSVVSLPIEPLVARLENLTAMLHFAILAARASNEIRLMSFQYCSNITSDCRSGASFAKKSHFISSMLKYVNQEYKSLLLGSSRPELVWMHAASVGAVCEILILTRFGVDTTPVVSVRDNINIPSARGMTEQDKNKGAMKLILRLVGHTFEMSYVICESQTE